MILILFRSGEEEVLEFQVQSLEGTIKQLPDSIAKASECSSRVTKRFEELKQYYDKCRAPLTNCVSIQERFQDIEKAIESVMFNINNCEKYSQNLCPRVEVYCTELEHLVCWYELYFDGYKELLFEIQRREAEEKRQQNLIQLMKKELDKMNEEESQKREDFLSEHGRYLPTSLFPSALRETAVHYRISGDIQPISLPGLSRKYTRD